MSVPANANTAPAADGAAAKRAYRTLKQADIAGKRVICRVDLNVPTEHGRISDRTRITRIVPTVRYLAGQGAKIILISHFGRPKDTFDRDYSLAPLTDALQEALPGITVKFAVDCIGDNARKAVDELQNGEALLLENLRFHKGEKKNLPDFADELASLGDIYVNESFSCSHRAHASITGLAERLPAYAGFLLDEEISALEARLSVPQTPLCAIVGGAKISTKINLLTHLVTVCKAVAVGGAMANTFLSAKGFEIGTSLYEEELIEKAKDIIALAERNGCELVLPTDVTAAAKFGDSVCDIYPADAVPADKMILDIGPDTVTHLCRMIEEARTLIWNGPLGVLEHKPYDTGTIAVARYAALKTRSGDLQSVAGGGDVIAGLQKAGLQHALSYVSTAGGAFLQWLENPALPGIKALEAAAKR